MTLINRPFPVGKFTDPDVTADGKTRAVVALDALRTVDEGHGASFTKWHETTSLPKATFNRAKDDLVSWGLIEKRGGKWVPL